MGAAAPIAASAAEMTKDIAELDAAHDDDDISDLEVLGAQIVARLNKAASDKRPKKAKDFEISAGYQLIEAQQLAGAAFSAWCARHIGRAMAEIARLIRLAGGVYIEPGKPAPPPPPAPRAVRTWPYTEWDIGRAVLSEYYCFDAGLNLAGEVDHEEFDAWSKWFDRPAPPPTSDQQWWSEFFAKAGPVVTRCRADLWEFKQRERRAYRAAMASQRKKERDEANAAGAFRYDQQKSLQENQVVFAEGNWTQTKKGSFSRFIFLVALDECWSVLVYQTSGQWGIRVDPPAKSKFVGSFCQRKFVTAYDAKKAALRFISDLFKAGGGQ